MVVGFRPAMVLLQHNTIQYNTILVARREDTNVSTRWRKCVVGCFCCWLFCFSFVVVFVVVVGGGGGGGGGGGCDVLVVEVVVVVVVIFVGFLFVCLFVFDAIMWQL